MMPPFSQSIYVVFGVSRVALLFVLDSGCPGFWKIRVTLSWALLLQPKTTTLVRAVIIKFKDYQNVRGE